jgi:predicted O-methyltransferase YrrM
MSDTLSETTERFLDLAHAEPEPLLAEMADHGREQSFPTIGPDAGRFLRALARLTGADRVFEFGSGFGYSGAWFAGALPADGELVLTEYDDDELDEAREFLGRGDYDCAVRFEGGDAIETFGRSDGPFDVVLIDHEKSRYVEAFDLAREKLSSHGAIVADNMLRGPASADDVVAALEGDDPADEWVAGIAGYVEHVRNDSEFETAFVPLGSGLAVSTPR